VLRRRRLGLDVKAAELLGLGGAELVLQIEDRTLAPAAASAAAVAPPSPDAPPVTMAACP